MDLIERLESLRIPDSEFFNISDSKRYAYQLLNDRLDDCLEIVHEWLDQEGYIQ